MPERPRRADLLARAAADWQDRHVIQHCARCLEPCCRLRTVVLELDWRRLCALYRIVEPRRAFDARLAAGKGPEHIRKHGDRYYAHGQPCPAFDEASHRCAVYGTVDKPPSCTEFPVYPDGDAVTADRRCEAVDVASLRSHLEQATGAPLIEQPDADFPELVSLVPRAPRRRRHSGGHLA